MEPVFFFQKVASLRNNYYNSQLLREEIKKDASVKWRVFVRMMTVISFPIHSLYNEFIFMYTGIM